jgi:hypothetical protein
MVLIGALGVFLAGASLQSTRSAGQGRLSIQSDPSGATVYVDGRPVGTTPLHSLSLALGDHRVRLVKDGYLENPRAVTIVAGKVDTLKVPLTSRGTSAIQNAIAAPLRIVVISGEDAVNIIQQKTAVAPVVEVRDRNNLPVSGAIVTFSIEGGKGAAFGGASTLTVTTNAAGQAAAASFSPLAAGSVQINVQAAFQGQLAAATIAQTNVLTAAEAAAAAAGGTSSAGGGSGAGGSAAGAGGGGGLSGLAIGGIVGGVAAGAAAVAAVSSGGDGPAAAPVPVNNAPVASGVSASPGTVLLGADPVAFSAQVTDPENDPITFRWDFGDGNTSTEAAPRHTYAAAGTFTVRLTVSDGRSTATGQTSVTVFSLTGSWRSDPVVSGFGLVQLVMSLTQTAGSVTGTTPVVTGPTGSGGPGTLQGTVRPTSPRVMMTWVLTNDGAAGVTRNYVMALDPGSDANTLTGTAGVPAVTFRRQ